MSIALYWPTIGRVLMKRSWLLLTVTTISMVASSAAISGEIYKWTDDAGNVHYEDRPTENQAVERLQIASRSTDKAALQEQAQARLEARKVADQVASEASSAPEKLTRREIRAEKAKRQEQCQKYRDQLDQVLRSRHLYRAGDDGERTYLDESEKQAERNRVQDQVKEYCGAG